MDAFFSHFIYSMLLKSDFLTAPAAVSPEISGKLLSYIICRHFKMHHIFTKCKIYLSETAHFNYI